MKPGEYFKPSDAQIAEGWVCAHTKWGIEWWFRGEDWIVTEPRTSVMHLKHKRSGAEHEFDWSRANIELRNEEDVFGHSWAVLLVRE